MPDQKISALGLRPTPTLTDEAAVAAGGVTYRTPLSAIKTLAEQPLQVGYELGNTIAVTAAEGIPTISNSADATTTLRLSPTFAGAGKALEIAMGASATGDAITIDDGAGALIRHTQAGLIVQDTDYAVEFTEPSAGTGTPGNQWESISGAGAPAATATPGAGGGSSTLRGGAGGNGDGVSLDGGTGGFLSLRAGAGGTGQAAVGGAGGFTILRGGAGGAAPISGTPGTGGSLTLEGGDGGLDFESVRAAGGALLLDTGAGGTPTLSIGTGNAGTVTVGRTSGSVPDLNLFGNTTIRSPELGTTPDAYVKVASMQSAGGDVATTSLYTSERDPNGIITAEQGSLCTANDGTVWKNTTGGTVWTELGPARLTIFAIDDTQYLSGGIYSDISGAQNNNQVMRHTGTDLVRNITVKTGTAGDSCVVTNMISGSQLNLIADTGIDIFGGDGQTSGSGSFSMQDQYAPCTLIWLAADTVLLTGAFTYV